MEFLYQLYQECSGICTDTRRITDECLFFALKGENFNGNKFASSALENGAKYAIIDEAEYQKDERFILVEDVLTAMQDLARHHRRQLTCPIIGITGSNGKTTTKELMRDVLRKKYKTFATYGNLNNHIGVPLSLLSINSSIEMAIIEMGANHQGEIKMLSEIAEPDFGLITNIGKAHIEGFGGEEGVLKGKTELYRFLDSNKGLVFVNQDQEKLVKASEGMNTIPYGTKEAWFSASPNEQDLYLSFTVKRGDDRSDVRTKLVGSYNFQNALAAIAVGLHFKVDLDLIVEALEEYLPENQRSQMKKTEHNELILDAYNANPSSVEAALRNLSKTEKEAFFILGDMYELGENELEEHKKIIDLAIELDLQGVTVGKKWKESDKSIMNFPDNDSFRSWLKSNPIQNRLILVKGSRSARLEEVIPSL